MLHVDFAIEFATVGCQVQWRILASTPKDIEATFQQEFNDTAMAVVRSSMEWSPAIVIRADTAAPLLIKKRAMSRYPFLAVLPVQFKGVSSLSI